MECLACYIIQSPTRYHVLTAPCWCERQHLMHITVPESCDVLQCVIKAVCSPKKNVLCAASAPPLSPYDSRRTENAFSKWTREISVLKSQVCMRVARPQVTESHSNLDLRGNQRRLRTATCLYHLHGLMKQIQLKERTATALNSPLAEAQDSFWRVFFF